MFPDWHRLHAERRPRAAVVDPRRRLRICFGVFVVLLAVIFHTSANAVLPLVVLPNRAVGASHLIDEWSVLAIWIAALMVLVIAGPRKLTRGEIPRP